MFSLGIQGNCDAEGSHDDIHSQELLTDIMARQGGVKIGC